KDQLIQAVTENKITVYNTKGGKTREVNVSNVAHRQIKNMLNNEYRNLKYSEKLFSKKSGDHKKVIKAIQNKVYLHRDKVTDQDRKSTRLNSSHVSISYAVFCLK